MASGSIGNVFIHRFMDGQLLPARRETYQVERPGVAMHGLTATAPKWAEVRVLTHTYVAAGMGMAIVAAQLALIGVDPAPVVIDQFSRNWPGVDVLACAPIFRAAHVVDQGTIYYGIIETEWRLRPLANPLGF